MHEKIVTVLGTGDYGRSLGKRLLNSKYDVVFGSRRPDSKNLGKLDPVLAQSRVLHIEDSLRASDVIFLCMPAQAYNNLERYRSILDGKIVVDVSNTRKRNKTTSNAERLSVILPTSHIVKAFNTVSAYSISSDVSGDRKIVYVCGEDNNSRDVVRQMSRDMGFVPMDCGGLLYARKLEAVPHKMMSGWGKPTVVVIITSIWWFFYGCLRYFYLKDEPVYTKERFPLNVTNKAFGCIGLTLICFAFIPGCLAGFAQMINGTKHTRFPRWLDAWMKMRKHLGYYALLASGIHTVMSLAILNPAYFASWFHFKQQVVDIDGSGQVVVAIASRMTWVGETVGLLGVLGIAGMAVMGVTSLPSVSSQLNWSEWRFFQSYLGWFTVLVATGHVTVLGLGGSWMHSPFFKFGQKMSFLTCLIPWLTIFLKVLVSLPGVTCYLTKIRNGYERGQPSDAEVPVERIANGISHDNHQKSNGVVSVTAAKFNVGEDNLAYVQVP